MKDEARTSKVKAQIVEAQHLLNRQRAGRVLDAKEAARLNVLITQLSGWSLADLLVGIPGVRISGLPMY